MLSLRATIVSCIGIIILYSTQTSAFGTPVRPAMSGHVLQVQDCAGCGSGGGSTSSGGFSGNTTGGSDVSGSFGGDATGSVRGDVTGSISVSGDSASTDGGGGGGAGVPGFDPIRAVRRDFLTIKTASLRLEKTVDACRELETRALRDCVANALDAYAGSLAQASTLLPPDRSPVADIIEKGAAKVRRAKSKREIVAAVRQVVADVRKSIELIIADDPIVASLSTRASNTIVSSLERTDKRLESAVGL
jgi:hypothetical protein